MLCADSGEFNLCVPSYWANEVQEAIALGFKL
jgi:hypothetical protein